MGDLKSHFQIEIRSLKRIGREFDFLCTGLLCPSQKFIENPFSETAAPDGFIQEKIIHKNPAWFIYPMKCDSSMRFASLITDQYGLLFWEPVGGNFHPLSSGFSKIVIVKSIMYCCNIVIVNRKPERRCIHQLSCNLFFQFSKLFEVISKRFGSKF